MRPNYKEIETLISMKLPFEHNGTMSGVIDGDTYKLFSYRTLIATYEFIGDRWWITEEKYSRTTSKQTGLIRRVATKDGWKSPLVVGK